MIFSFTFSSIISVVFLVAILTLQFFSYKRFIVGTRAYWFLFGAVVFYILGYYAFLTYGQRMLWLETPLTRYFLPPHIGYGYLFQYHFFRFLLYHLLALFVALVLWLVAHFYNRRSGGRYFYDEEIPIMLAVMTLLGFPGYHYAWVSFLALFFLSYFVVHVLSYYRFQRLRLSNDFSLPRISFYFFWVPVAFLVILIEYFFWA